MLLELNIVLAFLVPLYSSEAVLSCGQSIHCLGAAVSCECWGISSIIWRVQSATAPVFQATITGNTANPISADIFTAVLINVTQRLQNGFRFVNLSSKLTFMFMENVTVECLDNGGAAIFYIQEASKA